jgi:hypothetical protein
LCSTRSLFCVCGNTKSACALLFADSVTGRPEVFGREKKSAKMWPSPLKVELDTCC